MSSIADSSIAGGETRTSSKRETDSASHALRRTWLDAFRTHAPSPEVEEKILLTNARRLLRLP